MEAVKLLVRLGFLGDAGLASSSLRQARQAARCLVALQPEFVTRLLETGINVRLAQFHHFVHEALEWERSPADIEAAVRARACERAQRFCTTRLATSAPSVS